MSPRPAPRKADSTSIRSVAKAIARGVHASSLPAFRREDLVQWTDMVSNLARCCAAHVESDECQRADEPRFLYSSGVLEDLAAELNKILDTSEPDQVLSERCLQNPDDSVIGKPSKVVEVIALTAEKASSELRRIIQSVEKHFQQPPARTPAKEKPEK